VDPTNQWVLGGDGGEGSMVNSFDQKAHIITLTSATKSRPLNLFKRQKKISKKKKRGEIDG